jgi:isopenicillin N synthase-like dioxygenase
VNVGKLLPPKLVQSFASEQFLVIKLPNETRKKILSLFANAHSFFREPNNNKSKCVFAQDIGYRPLGREYSKSPDYPDQIESFSVAARLPISSFELPIASVRALNISMLEVFDSFERLAEDIVMRLATEISSDSLANRLRGGLRLWSRLQVNYSKPASTSLPFINETHEDMNLLTVTCANEPGLEVRLNENEFRPISTGDGEVVIFSGEIAWLLSGGQIRPGYHRVITNSLVQERLAVLFFADLDPLLCQPWIKNEINHGIDIAERSVMNVRRFGLKNFISPSA